MSDKRSPRPTAKRGEGAKKKAKASSQQSHATGTSAPSRPPPGLDQAKHTTAQRAAHQAQVLREDVVAAIMAGALGYDRLFDTHGYRAYLERVLEDANNPRDPIEVMMLQQLSLAHFRIGQLHASAGHAKDLEGVKVYNGAAARLSGEFRRTALALHLYRGRSGEGEPKAKLKIHKLAQ
jgi:hypothetical protein